MNLSVSKTIASIAVSVFLAISAFFMVNVELPSWSHWLSGLNVILFAIPAFLATRRWLGWREATVLWLMLGFYALGIETLAIYTGFPYGHFGYSDLLGAKLFGSTPWTVFLAWTPLIIGAYAVARLLFSNVALRIVVTTLLATEFDLVLDPGAVKLGFWQYASNAGFYGVPLSNFVGWLVTASVAAVLIEIFLSRTKPLLPTPVQLFSSAFLIVLFWTFIAVFAGMFWPAIVGASIVIGLCVIWFKYHYAFDEMLILARDDGSPTATMPKAEVHTMDTPLHLAFSIFLFNSKGELMLQQRALTKKTWPGVWSNSCCGHQMLHEVPLDGAKRRLKYELGISGVELTAILPEYRYRAEKDGVVENEICPVFVGFTDKTAKPRADEVEAVRFIKWQEFLENIRRADTDISPWAIEEAELLESNGEFQRMIKR